MKLQGRFIQFGVFLGGVCCGAFAAHSGMSVVLAEEPSASETSAPDEQPKLEFSNPLVGMVAGRAWQGAREDGMIEINDEGLMPRDLTMSVRQGILFFYNSTKDSPLKLEIDFGKNALVCYSSATPNLAFQGEGKLMSTRPLEPGNFASTCFPNIGTYAYRVTGVRGQKVPLEGVITVRPRS